MSNHRPLRLTEVLIAALGPALLIGGLLALYPVSVDASPKFTQQWGKPCKACHTAPPNLNDTGKKFRENGHKF